MIGRAGRERLEQLYARWAEKHADSGGTGMLWHLTLRHQPDAMTELSRRLHDHGASAADPFSATGLARRAARLGGYTAAYNLAMSCFNRRDLAGYRHWLRRAAKAGFPDAVEQGRRFETRLPHGAAHDIGRGRPWRAYD